MVIIVELTFKSWKTITYSSLFKTIWFFIYSYNARFIYIQSFVSIYLKIDYKALYKSTETLTYLYSSQCCISSHHQLSPHNPSLRWGSPTLCTSGSGSRPNPRTSLGTQTMLPTHSIQAALKTYSVETKPQTNLEFHA